MPDKSSLPIYEAYVVNSNDLLRASQTIKRAINRALKEGKKDIVRVQTKVYALIYSMYTEAAFMKLVFTPYGFHQNEIAVILKQRNFEDQWKKALQLAFRKQKTRNKLKREQYQKSNDINKIIEQYVNDPRIIRNKIAHGQWKKVLNRDLDKINNILTETVTDLTVVDVFRWFTVIKYLQLIMQDLIDSPDKGHYNNYFKHLQELETFLVTSSKWTVESKLRTQSMLKPVASNAMIQVQHIPD